MMPSFLKSLKFLLIFGLFICFTNANAQVKYDAIVDRIDSLSAIGLPKSALEQVDQLEKLARADKNVPQQIKAVIYRMTFQAYLQDEAFSAIVSRLKSDIKQAQYPEKPVLQSLLAQLYWKYYQQNRYQFSQRSQLLKPDTDFTKWDIQTVITESSHLYQLSLADAKQEQNTSVDVLGDVLEGDRSTRYLRPTLYDLLLQRALDFYLNDEPGITRPRLPFSLNDPAFFAESHTFAALPVNSTDTTSTYYRGIKYLQQATAFHLQARQDEAVADIDLQRLKFLFERSQVDHKDSLYLAALKRIAAANTQKPAGSEASILQGQYYQSLDSLTMAYNYYQQAYSNAPQSLGGKNAALLIEQIQQKTVSATVEDVNIPGKPLLALLSYKNLTSAAVMVYRLSAAQVNEYEKDYQANNQNISLTKYEFNLLKNLNPVQSQSLKWNFKNDYRNHTLEFKLNALSLGNYILLVKDGAMDNDTLTGLTNFKVSNIAYIARKNPDKAVELRVMDRETGKPLNGVHIALSGKTVKYDSGKSSYEEIDDAGISNNNGQFLTSKYDDISNLSVNLMVKGDTLSDGTKYINGALYNTDNEKSRDRTILFTDRQIYRPGQTIYFKGLQLKTYEDKNSILPGKKVTVRFYDANQKEISNLKLTTNDYGTLSGSFIIPQNILNGTVRLSTNYGLITVRVEEYKRPTFQVEFLPVKESYKLNDSVTLKGKVTAFSGYGISQAKVALHITRAEQWNYRNYNLRRTQYNSQVAEIKTDTVLTDDQGNYKLKFKAIPGETDNTNAVYTYTVSADVTDASYETHSGRMYVTIGNNNIQIVSNIPGKLLAKDTFKLPVSITNLNDELQKGDLKVEIYALKDPGQAFKNRLWTKPDQYFLSEADFKADFPDYAFANEDNTNTWPQTKLVSSLNIKADTDKVDSINLQQLREQGTGMYKVIISARNEKGDTVSTTSYVNLIAKPAKPVNIDDWVIPVSTSVKPGNNAEFFIGAGEKTNVLVEEYHEAKLISSKWITINKWQQSILIPVRDTDKDLTVQFLMAYHNRLYNSYNKINIINPDNNLDIKFITIHNKLQPGEKDEWKLQISGKRNEKEAAEMVAGLYDASLDDITPAQDWQHAINRTIRYQPNYFTWISYDFVRPSNTQPIDYFQYNFGLKYRDYEELDLMGYNYFGGYNFGYHQYLQRVKENQNKAQNDQQLHDDYLKYAKQVKNGYNISGTVKDKNGTLLAGVTVWNKGAQITTVTNSKGFFITKVPDGGTLIFSFIGYSPQVITTTKTANLNVKMEVVRNELGEVVVIGYGTQKASEANPVFSAVEIKQPVGNSSIRIRGVTTAAVEGKVAGVQVINDYGQQSKKGDPGINIDAPNANNPITIRRNFNETAFFYPQLHTDENGSILIDFTIPDALTRWRFKAFAHTKQLSTGYVEREIVTQKQLSISANMPRFLREGDTLTVSARLANLTAKELKGKIRLQLFNALNMQPVSIVLNPADTIQQFDIAAAVNKAVSFKLVIPPGLDALTYRLTAEADNYSDGEENTLPVLPNRMLVTESMSMMVRAGQTRNFTFDKLVNNTSTTLKSKTLTLEYTQNPAWYAVQALPYMMEFPYECSEQIFSRYYANNLGTSLVNSMPIIKQVFEQWKNKNSTELLSNMEKNQDLKSTLLEETPWLRDALSESEQKKRIALLFDLNNMSNQLQLNLDQLQKRQLPDGGFPWFGGDRSDRFITQHILAGIGQLYHLKIAGDKDQTLKAISYRTLGYMDAELIADDNNAQKLTNYENRGLSSIEMHAWYTRSYFGNEAMDSVLKIAFSNYLKRAEKRWMLQNIYDQGMIALTMQRYGKPLVAQAIIKSLKETARQSDDMGMYWSQNQPGYFWYQSPIETQSLMIELFTEVGGDQKAVDEMKIWLLRNKQTNSWKTTKATAAACYALLLKQADWLSPNSTSEIKLDGKPLDVLKPDIKADAGTGYIKTSWADEQVNPAFGKIQITNYGKSISWGALHWQYLEQLDKITPSQTDIHLERKYFIVKQTDAGAVLTAVDASHQPKTGDLLKVVVYLKAGRDFEYVQLKDMRPAGTEPVDALSGYKYQDGLYYYQVTKDVATNFFISYLNKGNYVFEYQLRVAQPGNFSTGITTVQSMYAPEFNAHSQGERIIFGAQKAL